MHCFPQNTSHEKPGSRFFARRSSLRHQRLQETRRTVGSLAAEFLSSLARRFNLEPGAEELRRLAALSTPPRDVAVLAFEESERRHQTPRFQVGGNQMAWSQRDSKA